MFMRRKFFRRFSKRFTPLLEVNIGPLKFSFPHIPKLKGTRIEGEKNNYMLSMKKRKFIWLVLSQKFLNFCYFFWVIEPIFQDISWFPHLETRYEKTQFIHLHLLMSKICNKKKNVSSFVCYDSDFWQNPTIQYTIHVDSVNENCFIPHAQM